MAKFEHLVDTEYELLVEVAPHLLESIERYREDGLHPGSFLTNVLKNNLVQAVNYADTDNQKLLALWARYMVNKLPRGCWGSTEKVNTWIEMGGLNGLHNNTT